MKHALQARYSRSNPASTHRAAAAAAARCLHGGAKRRSSPWTTADLPGAPPPPPHPVLTTVLLGRVQPQSTHSSELCFRALLTHMCATTVRRSPHARTLLELSAPLTCASNHVRPIVVVTLSCPYVPSASFRAARVLILPPCLSSLCRLNAHGLQPRTHEVRHHALFLSSSLAPTPVSEPRPSRPRLFRPGAAVRSGARVASRRSRHPDATRSLCAPLLSRRPLLEASLKSDARS